MIKFSTKLSLVLCVIGLLFNACMSSKNVADNNETMWVNSTQQHCTGVAPMLCMRTQTGETMDETKWKTYYGGIENFSYQPGYLYKLEVTREELDPANVPADASNIKITLVRVLSQEKQPAYELNGTWNLTHIKSDALAEDGKNPTLYISLEDMKANGTDGCNNYTGTLLSVDNSTIGFSPMASTRKMCPDMNVADQYLKLLTNSTYTVNRGVLMFTDEGGTETLRFSKGK